MVTGQIAKSLALHDEANEVAMAFMPPMIRLVSIKSQQPNLLVMQGKPEAAVALTDEITAQLQPPLDAYMNFSYTGIYGETGNRTAFREWAAKTQRMRDQLPEIFYPFIEMESATLAIWEGDFEVAVSHLDRANEMLGQSFIRIAHDNLGTLEFHVEIGGTLSSGQRVR